MEATYCVLHADHVDSGRVLEQGQASLYTGKFSKESVEGAKSSSGQSVFSLTANKRVQVPLNLNCSVEDGVGKNDKFENHNSPVVGKGGREGDKFNGATNMNPPSDSLPPMRPGNHEECRVLEIEMNQGAQSLPDSPLSFSDAKGSDDDSCDRSSEHVGINCC